MTIQYHDYSIPRLFNTTTIQYHDYSIPRLFNTTTIQYHDYSIPRLFNTTTIQYHDYSIPRLFNTTTIQYHDYSIPRLFNTTIWRRSCVSTARGKHGISILSLDPSARSTHALCSDFSFDAWTRYFHTYTRKSSHFNPAHPISAAAYTASGGRLVFSLARCVACAVAWREEDVRAGLGGKARALNVYRGCEMEVDLFPESDTDGSENVKRTQSLEEQEQKLWRADRGVRVGPFGDGGGEDAILARRDSEEWQSVWLDELEKRDSVIAEMSIGDDGPADANPNEPDEQQQQQQVNPSPPASPSRPQHRASIHLSVPVLYTDQEKNTPDSKFSSDSSGTSTTSRRRKGMLRKMRSWLKTKRTQDESSAPTSLQNKMPKDVWRRRSEGLPHGNTESATERARTFPGFP
ncbi:predicted protein [Plenodomus lingam JN3]|uniref:Predicted protein n=1 Tax=Leptosphaeria maculans (strain JN3 / isolate v23.1.3 / race Av1-4-5-6-7-8) TaxID=985895 RepID=E4ZNX9_LEPMJ|nr:predicted protein [Plenodomus lingam JN3]CBX93348.1 predicted protein [Plenodomus lingam JN3]